MTSAQGATTRERYLVSRIKVQPTGWQVLIQQPLSQLQREIERYYLMTIALALAAIGLSLLFARLIAGNVTRPLEQLVETVRAVAMHGTLHPPLAVASHRAC